MRHLSSQPRSAHRRIGWRRSPKKDEVAFPSLSPRHLRQSPVRAILPTTHGGTCMPQIAYDRDADAVYITLRAVAYAYGKDLDESGASISPPIAFPVASSC